MDLPGGGPGKGPGLPTRVRGSALHSSGCIALLPHSVSHSYLHKSLPTSREGSQHVQNVGQGPGPSLPFSVRGRGTEITWWDWGEAEEWPAENLSQEGREVVGTPVSLGARAPGTCSITHRTSLPKPKFEDKMT